MQLGQKLWKLPVLECLSALDLVKRVSQRWGQRAVCSYYTEGMSPKDVTMWHHQAESW